MKKSHGLGTQHENETKKWLISDDFWLKIPVIDISFSTKSVLTSGFNAPSSSYSRERLCTSRTKKALGDRFWRSVASIPHRGLMSKIKIKHETTAKEEGGRLRECPPSHRETRPQNVAPSTAQPLMFYDEGKKITTKPRLSPERGHDSMRAYSSSHCSRCFL